MIIHDTIIIIKMTRSITDPLVISLPKLLHLLSRELQPSFSHCRHTCISWHFIYIRTIQCILLFTGSSFYSASLFQGSFILLHESIVCSFLLVNSTLLHRYTKLSIHLINNRHGKFPFFFVTTKSYYDCS